MAIDVVTKIKHLKRMKFFNKLLGWCKVKFLKHIQCTKCYRAFPKANLKFKRLLGRDEAEKLDDNSIELKSHFVYTCPVCKGDIIDV